MPVSNHDAVHLKLMLYLNYLNKTRAKGVNVHIGPNVAHRCSVHARSKRPSLQINLSMKIQTKSEQGGRMRSEAALWLRLRGSRSHWRSGWISRGARPVMGPEASLPGRRPCLGFTEKSTGLYPETPQSESLTEARRGGKVTRALATHGTANIPAWG